MQIFFSCQGVIGLIKKKVLGYVFLLIVQADKLPSQQQVRLGNNVTQSLATQLQELSYEFKGVQSRYLRSRHMSSILMPIELQKRQEQTAKSPFAPVELEAADKEDPYEPVRSWGPESHAAVVLEGPTGGH
jgi:hypothetical protein